MGSTNNGSQNIGWIYTTPLQSRYLNSFNAGMATPGLLTRTTTVNSMYNVDGENMIEINPFSAVLSPITYSTSGQINTDIPAFSDGLKSKLVKITTESPIQLTVNNKTIAIGMYYTSSPKGIELKNYADFVVIKDSSVGTEDDGLTTENILKWKNMNMIIIGTCAVHSQMESTGRVTSQLTFSSNGATLSSLLLEREGWNNGFYIGMKSILERAENMNLSKPETWPHNNITVNSISTSKTTKSFLNGWNGLVQINEKTAFINANFLKYSGTCIANALGDLRLKMNESGIPYKYQLLVLDTEFETNSSYLKIVSGFDTIPVNGMCIKDTPGGVVALMMCNFTSVDESGLTVQNPIWNNISFIPVAKETTNVYYTESDGGTIVIQ